MILQELKDILKLNGSKHFRMVLPSGTAVPLSFHVTEVGRVHKSFIDCGGTFRETVACQLQVWVGEDEDHRIETGKAARILEKSRPFLSDDSIPVEVEYEDEVISQYTIEDHRVEEEAVVLILAHKHTDCLAPELCGIPMSKDGEREPTVTTGSCRPGKSGCC
jgi:hypothetical protein